MTSEKPSVLQYRGLRFAIKYLNACIAFPHIYINIFSLYFKYDFEHIFLILVDKAEGVSFKTYVSRQGVRIRVGVRID